jgi:putative sterol carrier protein
VAGTGRTTRTRTDPTAEFFEALGKRGHEPFLTRAKGTICLEFTDGRRAEAWRVTLSKGNIAVARGRGPADCVVRASKSLLDELVTGRANAMASLCRGELSIVGDYNLLVIFRRVLPGPPRKRGRRQAAGYARRQQ